MLLYLVHGRGFTENFFKAGNASVIDAAGDDAMIKLQVCPDIQGESVHAYVTGTLDPHCTQFAVADPDTRPGRHSPGINAVFRGRPDNHLFK